MITLMHDADKAVIWALGKKPVTGDRPAHLGRWLEFSCR